MQFSYRLIDYARMLQDNVRREAFSRALERVCPGRHLLELGGGTGFFACLAAKKGARKVVSLDFNSVIELGPATAKSNGLNNIEFVQGLVQAYESDEKADIILHDMRGNLPIHENNLSTLKDAGKRLLAEGGRFLPWKDIIYGCLVEDAPFYEEMESIWGGSLEGLDLTSARIPSHGMRRYEASEHSRPWPKLALGSIEYSKIERLDFESTLTMEADRNGLTHGICLWFEMFLTDEIKISTDPWLDEDERGKTYGVKFLPWENPIKLRRGGKYSVKVDLTSWGNPEVKLFEELGWARRPLGHFAEARADRVLALNSTLTASEETEHHQAALDFISSGASVKTALEGLEERFPRLSQEGLSTRTLLNAVALTKSKLVELPQKSQYLQRGQTRVQLSSSDEALLSLATETLSPSWAQGDSTNEDSDETLNVGLDLVATTSGLLYGLKVGEIQANLATEERFLRQVRDLVLRKLYESTGDSVALQCGYTVDSSGATLIFHDNEEERRKLTSHLAPSATHTNPEVALLDLGGCLIPYLGSKEVDPNTYPVRRVAFPGDAPPRRSLAITLALGRCFNPGVVENPLLYFRDLFDNAKLIGMTQL